jgi:hypothetical protein
MLMIMTKEMESSFMKSLGKYQKPRIGERIRTDYGVAEIIKVSSYHEVVEEMERNGVSKEEIDRFTFRVEHFLGDKKKYYECLIKYEDGELDSIDWSEYLAARKFER